MCAFFVSKLIIHFAVGISAIPAGEDFSVKLDSLRRQNHVEIGRKSAIEAYEKLIRDHKDDPQVAEAMLYIASLYENENPGIGMFADPDSAFIWYKRAALASSRGTELWVKSKFMLVNRLLYRDIAEARKHLSEIMDARPQDSLVHITVEHTLLCILIIEKDLPAADQKCRAILNWYAEPSRVPKDGRKKSDVDSYICNAGCAMVHAYISAPMSKQDKIRRITDLMSNYGSLSCLNFDGHKAIELVRTLPDTYRDVVEGDKAIDLVQTLPDTERDFVQGDKVRSSNRLPYMFIGISSVILVCIILYYYKRHGHGKQKA